MFIAYYDETGDDGYPHYSSPIFVLTATYISATHWKQTFLSIQDFRRDLANRYRLPVKTELHAKPFLLNKKIYLGMNISDDERVAIIGEFCDFIASQPIRIINVVINKKTITVIDYPVLEKSLTYSIQGIENDLVRNYNSANFLIISDEGRLVPMRTITRKIQVDNPISAPGTSDRQEIQLLIEDPFARESKDSYFIQMSDLVGFVVYMHMLKELNVGEYHNRMPPLVNEILIRGWLNRLTPSLNLEAASQQHGYGIVCYPRGI
jgi:Protein of unknown function (DUF3800)